MPMEERAPSLAKGTIATKGTDIVFLKLALDEFDVRWQLSSVPFPPLVPSCLLTKRTSGDGVLGIRGPSSIHAVSPVIGWPFRVVVHMHAVLSSTGAHLDNARYSARPFAFLALLIQRAL
eukprot:4595022-Amphidinium_carterae.3